MSRIAQRLTELASENRKALVAYIVAGDPDRSVTVPFMHSLAEQGTDIIELGVPFSDPMAEGPIIQRAHERALAHNTSLKDALDMVAEFRVANQHTAVILMGYANPVEAMGYQDFCRRAVEVGLDGVLTVDLPPEEATDFNGLLADHGLDAIYLVSPTTDNERAKTIASMATGFLYYVSLKGVTGAASLDLDDVHKNIAKLKAFAKVPVCVGFGIKDAESARSLASTADGVVVGSAIVDLLAQGDAGMMKAENLVAELRSAIDDVK